MLEWEEEGDTENVRKAGRYTSEDIHRAIFPKADTASRYPRVRKASGKGESVRCAGENVYGQSGHARRPEAGCYRDVRANRIRVISARPMSRNERQVYEKEN